MKTRYYIDKTTWSEGPWKYEYDAAHWIDEETSYVCSMRRNIYGTWSGYVGVDEDHPLFRVANTGEEYKYIDVHGGVLSAEFGLENDTLFTPPKRLWWISFSTISANDLIPETNQEPTEKAPKHKKRLSKDITYKDFEYVKEQVTSLCHQLSFFDVRIALR